MKIMSWNCNGSFREKINSITQKNQKTYVDADIYVICECENPDESHPDYKEYKELIQDLFGDNHYWVGNLPYKGLGIFAKDNVDLIELETNGNFEFFKAFRVNDSFNLLTIWVQDKDKEKGLNPYVEMIHDFFDANTELFDENLIICGDLNSSAVFDHKHNAKDDNGNAKNHTNLDKKLNDKGLFSVYHELSNEENGKEKQKTFFLYRHLNYQFHLDYVYANKEIIEKTILKEKGKNVYEDLPNKFEILDKWNWISLSDHLPVVFEWD
ncbi:endonuclease/exonuclease/phosphatase family protein [Methanosphaera sp. BMS]|uniref:endonuclease/exonuclease/phosphatase family protein n=1 Tax=Methanosphaera sp. BMS TaxID=1789762 RepID=UPI000DC1CFE5|nr:endonuclease/exonuclease/phosphatase family protein [Methanosphaera sp. BMS]AWX31861.1 hypothetical protein AW729_01585 [Methanosphaera sp. BMS]